MQACDDYLDSLPEDILAQINAALDSDSDVASQTVRDSDTSSLPGDADFLHADELGNHEGGGIGLLDDYIHAVRQPDSPPNTDAAQASSSSSVSAEQSAMSSEADAYLNSSASPARLPTSDNDFHADATPGPSGSDRHSSSGGSATLSSALGSADSDKQPNPSLASPPATPSPTSLAKFTAEAQSYDSSPGEAEGSANSPGGAEGHASSVGEAEDQPWRGRGPRQQLW